MDQQGQDMLVELTSRIENLENAVTTIADNFTKLEAILDDIAAEVTKDTDQ